MRALPETVERQQFGLLHVSLALRPAHVTEDMERQAAVAVLLPPHLKPEPDVPGLEDVRATVVFDRVPLG